jgi:hypothetical protein
MSQSERHDLDDAIDRAAQQLVMHEPSPRLYAAVMASIEAGSSKSGPRRTASPWTTWRWAVVGMSAAALVTVSPLGWQWLTQTQPQSPVAFPALPAAPQLARIAPPEAGASVAPQPVSLSPTPSSASRTAARIDEARPAFAPVADAGSANDAERIQVDTIPVADIAVAGIPVSTISIREIDGNDPIPISTIGADGADAR